MTDPAAPVAPMVPTAPTVPAGAAAPPLRRVLAQGGFETRAVLRNGEQLMVTLIIPLLVLVVLSRTTLVDLGAGSVGTVWADRSRIDLVTPGVLGLAVLAGSMTSQAIATAFDRRNGVLRLLATTPLGPVGLLAGKALAVLAVAACQMALIAVVGAVCGWRPSLAGLVPALLILLLGIAACTALALLLAGALRSEAVLAVANLLLVALAVAGGVVLPVADLPGWWAPVAQWLPSGALGEGLRTALLDGGWPLAEMLTLAGWTVLLGAGVRRWFRWAS